MAFDNFVGLVANAIDRFADVAGPREIECMVSCALIPNQIPFVTIETQKKTDRTDLIDKLSEDIRGTPPPSVNDGLVAFAIYRRLNLDAPRETELRPFRTYHEKIVKHGFEQAILNAASANNTSDQQQTLLVIRALQRVASWFKRSPEDTQASEDPNEEWIRWMHYVDDYFSNASISTLKSILARDPFDLASRIALAGRYTSNEDWENAIECYTAAIHCQPDCAPFIANRGRVYRLAGNRQASLVDWNAALKIAPADATLLFHRSEIYSDLEAWPQALADLDAAVRIAPHELDFLFARANVQLAQGEFQSAVHDLQRIVSLDPNSGYAHGHLAWLLQNADQPDLDSAIAHVTTAIELIPEDADFWIQRSLAYASQNKTELALEDCERAIEIRPNHGSAHAARGRVLQAQGDFHEAIASCDKALELGWETPSVFLSRGFSYAATDRHELALSDCDAVEAIDPTNPLACQLRGMLNFELGELDEAREALTKAIDLVPDWVEPREQLALLHRINENPQAAVEEQSILVAQQPERAGHYINRAFAYTQLGDFEKARADYDKACQIEPENEDLLFLRGCYFLERQELDLALEDFDGALSLSNDHDDARYRRASTLLGLERAQEALADFAALMAKHPENPHAFSGHAYANELLGNVEAAEKDLERIQELAPESSSATSLQSQCARVRRLESEGKTEEAIAAAEQIIDMAPDEPIGYSLRGWIHWYSEQYVEAFDDYSQLLEVDPDDMEALNGRGQVQAEMGEWSQALDDLDRVIDHARKMGATQLLAYALNGRALALAGINRMNDSTRDYEESIRLCPDNSWAYYHRGIVLHQRGDSEQAEVLLRRALDEHAPPLTRRKRDRTLSILNAIGSES